MAEPAARKAVGFLHRDLRRARTRTRIATAHRGARIAGNSGRIVELSGMFRLFEFSVRRIWLVAATVCAALLSLTPRLHAQGSVQTSPPPPTDAPVPAESTPPVFYFTTLAGTASAGTADGSGSAARFYRPQGLTIDDHGNLYVADSYNAAIRKITPQGLVTTVAGKPGDARVLDGPLASARFLMPSHVSADRSGALYVADVSTVRRIGVDGTIATIAGTAEYREPPSLDGTGAEARFDGIGGLAVGPSGIIYATDDDARTIRRITPAGVVTTLAGSVGVRGSADGTGADASFSYPLGLAADATGTLWVPDLGNNTIRRVTSAGAVTTFAGRSGVTGIADGLGAAAEFKLPVAVAPDLAGNLYVADASRIRAITPSGSVTTLAGGEDGSADGVGPAARFRAPEGVVVDLAGNVYVCDTGNNAIRKITPTGVVTTLAGLWPDQATGAVDGVGSAARFNQPLGIAVTPDGVCYVADTANHVIRRIARDGTVTTLAGSAGQSGYADGTGAAARFDSPNDLALDRAGNLYVIDGRATIRKVTPEGVVTTLAGSGEVGIPTNGHGRAAVFWFLTAIAVAPDGNIWVAESRGHPSNYSGYWWARLRKVTPDGNVTGDQMLGSVAWPHTWWSGLAFAPDGTLYACDSTYFRLIKVTAQSTETHNLNPARFSPYRVAVTSGGDVYLTEGYSPRAAIGRFYPDGTVDRVGGSLSWLAVSHRDGLGSEALFNGTAGLAVDSTGALYVACTDNTIRKGVVASAPVIATQPESHTVSPGAAVTFSVSAAATPAPSYQWYLNGNAIVGATASTYAVASANSANAGNYHVIVTNELGTVTSAMASLALSAPPTGGSSGGASAGGGGGAPSEFFLVAGAVFAVARVWQRRRTSGQRE